MAPSGAELPCQSCFEVLESLGVFGLTELLSFGLCCPELSELDVDMLLELLDFSICPRDSGRMVQFWESAENSEYKDRIPGNFLVTFHRVIFCLGSSLLLHGKVHHTPPWSSHLRRRRRRRRRRIGNGNAGTLYGNGRHRRKPKKGKKLTVNTIINLRNPLELLTLKKKFSYLCSLLQRQASHGRPQQIKIFHSPL
ncbi:hypothetical protein M5K25_017022 [Dendrobium thyrsiflorum]|uniref:Uncharacterized protein n=1 Tax=Dendrobium thyrsiflorum TaxID=117978 RepID=A0ABD0UTH6_DENTH